MKMDLSLTPYKKLAQNELDLNIRANRAVPLHQRRNTFQWMPET
jgi:hypothetical protein